MTPNEALAAVGRVLVLCDAADIEARRGSWHPDDPAPASIGTADIRRALAVTP